jgi:quinohemoprotein ethanol dehydrogenase
MGESRVGKVAWAWIALGAATLVLGGCGKGAAPQPEAGVGADANWTAPHGGPDEASYSRLAEITPANAARLGLAWSMDLPDEVTLESTPLHVDGTLYFAGGYAEVYAVEAATGKLLWKFDPETWKRRPDKFHFGANRGIAYENGRIFTVEMDGTVNALDAKTGKVLWASPSIPEGPKFQFTNSSGAPRTMNGKVIIGNGGADAGARGFVTAFDAVTGKQLWRFFTVPGSPEENAGDPAMEMAAKTWSADFWKTGGGGGTVWNGMTFDAEKNRIYIGVGNGGPYDPEKRSPGGGDNLFTAGIVALDADTGKYVWHYQQNPRDAWDYKATPNMVLATVNLEGGPKKVLMHAPTNGFFYVLDRDTGKLLNEPKATTYQNWAKGIDMKTGRPIENANIRYETGRFAIWPGTIGGHNWQAMSYSPKAGLVYIPVHQVGALFSRDMSDLSEDAVNIMGLVVKPVVEKPGDGKGYLVAWDPVNQREVWKVTHDAVWNGGVLSTAGGVVFQGDALGKFSAYDASSGDRLWQFNAGLGIIAAPMSFSHGGKQYVSILVGWGGTSAAMSRVLNVGWKYGAQPRRLLTFAIGGTAKLPPSPPRDMKVYALDDPELKLNEADVMAGRMMSLACMSCHGAGVEGAGSPGPDLRESAIALKADDFIQYVKVGNPARGMPAQTRFTDDQLRQLHAYIRARAREALGLRPPYDPVAAAAAMAAAKGAAPGSKAGL